MKRCIACLIILLSLFPIQGICKQEEIIGEGEYVMGEGETMEVAGEKARKNAIRAAAEEAGAFVRSFTKLQNFVLQEDVIEVVANHSMKVTVLDEQTELVGKKSVRFRTRIKATISSAEVEANIKKAQEDRTVVNAYSRLKADYEKQNKEVEQLKQQLVNAVGGDKKRIARLLSEEEKKFKANLWVEKARYQSYDEALNSYKKALEFNPELAQAYLGIAKELRLQNLGAQDELQGLDKKVKGLREALANLDKAVSVDGGYADAYAMRAGVLEEIRASEKIIYEQGDKINDFKDMEKQYYERILKDINRSIALNATNKADMYQKRASFYLHTARLAEVEQFSSETVQENYDRALADVDQAITLCKGEDSECLVKYYRTKMDIYSNIGMYYDLSAHNPVKAKEAEKLRSQWYQKVKILETKQSNQSDEEDIKFKSLRKPSELGKLLDYLDIAWRERVFGSLKDLGGKSEEEREKIGKQKEAEVKKRISAGAASAEDYLFMAMFAFDDIVETRKNNYDKGVSLFEKRNPEGREALLLVRFYTSKSSFHSDQQQYDHALNGLNKAKTLADKHLIPSKKLLDLFDVQLFEKAGLPEGVYRLNKEDAEAFYWLMQAWQITRLRAGIYEKSNLPAKATEDYRYLCETFKDKEACKDVERLK
jgi:hypothetical protein